VGLCVFPEKDFNKNKNTLTQSNCIEKDCVSVNTCVACVLCDRTCVTKHMTHVLNLCFVFTELVSHVCETKHVTHVSHMTCVTCFGFTE